MMEEGAGVSPSLTPLFPLLLLQQAFSSAVPLFFLFFLRLDLDVEEADLLGEVARVLLTLGLDPGGIGLVGSDEVSGTGLALLLHHALNDVADAEVVALDRLAHDPGPRFLVGLDVVAVAHFLEQIHHGAELALVLDWCGLLRLSLKDLLQCRIVGGDIGRAVLDIHVDENLAGLVIVLAGLDLLDPRCRVGVDGIAEQIDLLAASGSRRAVESRGGEGGEALGADTAHTLFLFFVSIFYHFAMYVTHGEESKNVFWGFPPLPVFAMERSSVFIIITKPTKQTRCAQLCVLFSCFPSAF
jgi:hypothetical protein